MKREDAYKLMTEMIQSQNLRRHGLAVEAIMKALCIYLREKHPELPAEEFNEEEWGIVGLLHDADYELVAQDLSQHTLMTERKLRELGVEDRIINGIKGHHRDYPEHRTNLMGKAVYCADELSGLITAVALVRPDKSLKEVGGSSVMKKFKIATFAAGALRDQIEDCDKELGIPLEEFVTIALKAMQDIAPELGL